jgi:hypothetical protein
MDGATELEWALARREIARLRAENARLTASGEKASRAAVYWHNRMAALGAKNAKLRKLAQAVVARWEAPMHMRYEDGAWVRHGGPLGPPMVALRAALKERGEPAKPRFYVEPDDEDRSMDNDIHDLDMGAR